MRWNIRCCVCGQFCQVADEATPFGGYGDYEPPEPELFCAKCAKREYDNCIATGKIYSGYWGKPQWERIAAKILGYIAAGPKGAAWSHWFKSDKVPEGWEIHTLPIWNEHKYD